MIIHELKVAWRSLLKYRWQSVMSITGLVIGFVAFIFGGYWWDWENHFDTFHPDSDRLYAIVTYGMVENADGSQAGLNQLHKDDAAWFMNNMPEIQKMCSVSEYYFETEENGNKRYFSAYGVDTVFFQLFYQRFLDGGYKGLAPDGQSVILTRSMAMQFFGTIRCTGKKIHLGKDERGREEIFNVGGVIDDYPANSEFSFDLLLYKTPEFNRRHRAATYVLLDKHADIGKVRQKIAGHKSVSVDPYGIDEPSLWKFSLCSLPEMHRTCHPQLGNRFRNIRILAVAGLLAFVSALMNHLVLFTERRQKRDREYITRVSLGSSPGKMVRKMYIELLLPLLIALGIALCLAELLFPFYQEYTAIYPVEERGGLVVRMDRTGLLSGMIEYMVISCILFGVVSFLPVRFILCRQNKRMINSEYALFTPLLFRRFLIAGQIFIGTLFMVSASGMYKQLYFLTHADLGIDIRNVVQIAMGYSTSDVIDKERLRTELLNSPFAEEVTMTNDPVLSSHGIYYGNKVGYLAIGDRDPKRLRAEGEEDYLFSVEENFFDFFRLRLKAGTFISAENPYDYVVNETGFHELGFPDLLEQRIGTSRDGRQSKVSGIIKDYHYAPLQYPVRKVFFEVERGKQPWSVFHYVYVRYKEGRREQMLAHIQSVMKKYDREEVKKEQKLIELSTVIDEFNRPERDIFTLFMILAALCVLISSFGIYSLVSLSAEQRKKEIAIRKVNGATFSDMFFMFLKEYLYLAVVGIGAALGVGFVFVQRWLETYASHTGISVMLFIMVVLIVGGIVWGAVALQVKKAVGVNPAEALGSET